MRTLSKILGLVLFLASPLLAQPPGPPISPGSSGGSGNVTASGSEVCTDNQLLRANGTAPTAIQCSVLTVSDTTGNLTAPGALTISTAASNGDITLDPHGTGDVVITQNSYETALRSQKAADFYIRAGDLTYGDTPKLIFTAGSPTTGGTFSFGNGGAEVLLNVLNYNVLEQYRSDNQQTYRLYNTYTGASNYERLSLSGTAGSSVNINAETAGTGADDLDINLTSAGNGGVAYRRKVKADIDGETTTLAQSGWVWTNTGDGDGEAITLLNDPTVGTNYCVAVDVAQTITVAPSTGESLYYGTDQCVVSLTSNSIGSTLCVTAITGGSGAKWMTFSSMGSWTCND